jgi:hypothetical protein
MGRSDFYAPVTFAAPGVAGSVQRMRLIGSNDRSLLGVPVQ